jgi:cytochrome c oxidase cbb3-type subunit 3
MRRATGSLVVLSLLLADVWICLGCRQDTRAPAAVVRSDSVAADTSIYSARVLPIPELGYSAREGMSIYRHYCVTCHGEQGGGDGFNAYNLDPKPRSLADSAFQVQHSDSDLVSAIRSGGGAVGLSTGMPPWGRTLSERQILNVVTYVRTLAKSEP